MSRVASQANAVHSQYRGASAHHPAAAEGKQPSSSPFAALLDTTPAPTDRPERPQVAADGTSDRKGDPRIRRTDDKDRASTDAGKPTADADAATTNPVDAHATDQPVAKADPAGEISLTDGTGLHDKPGEVTDIVADPGKDAGKDVGKDPAKDAGKDAPVPQLATDQPAPVAPTVVAAPVAPTIVAAPLAPPVTVADKTADAAPDGVAVEPVGVRTAPTQGVADTDGLVTRKGPSAPNTSDATKVANANKAPNAKTDAGAPPAQSVSADTAQANVEPAPQASPQAGSPTGTNAAGKTAHAPGRAGRDVESNAAAKADESATRPDTADTLSADKPADPAQVTTVQHSAQRTAAPTAASSTTTASTASNATPAPTVVPVAGLAVAIAGQAQAGRNRFEIRLDPPELGRIDVRLDVDRDGRVTSRLIADKAETLDLLRRDAPDLQRALQDAGLKTSDSGLQFSLRDQSFAGQNQDQSGNGRPDTRIVVPDPEMPPVDAVQTSYGRALRVGGGIDIRV